MRMHSMGRSMVSEEGAISYMDMHPFKKLDALRISFMETDDTFDSVVNGDSLHVLQRHSVFLYLCLSGL